MKSEKYLCLSASICGHKPLRLTSRMKILLITSFFPPTHTAGTEKRTLGYALKLHERGHQVQVLCAGDWEKGAVYWNGHRDEVYRQIPVRRIDFNWTLAPNPNRYLYRNPLAAKKLEQWLKQWQPDIVHITSCLTLSASVIEAVKAQNLPLVLTLTDYWFICPRISLLRSNGSLCNGRTTHWDCLQCLSADTKAYRGLHAILPKPAAAAAMTWLSRHSAFSKRRGLRGMALDMAERKAYLAEMINAADRITAPSDYLRQVFHNSGNPADIQVIHSGHDLSWLRKMPPKNPSPVIRFGYIGQVIPVKGVHTLLQAFIAANLKERARLDIFGGCKADSDYFKQLESLAAGQETIRFHGPFQHSQLGEVLARLDVLVAPSEWHENNPRVIQEAFAGKTPVIASDVGGIAEFVRHEENGLLFKRGNAADLAVQLQRIANETDLLPRLQQGLPRVKTGDEEVDELETLYKELLQTFFQVLSYGAHIVMG